MNTETVKPEKRERPLSPHLQVYKPQMTSMLSIFHRVTGVGLSIGLLAIIWMLVAAASGAEAYAVFADLAQTKWGLAVAIAFSFAFFYHLCNGIRHIVWDTGNLFSIEKAKAAGYVVFYGAIAITAAFWAVLLV